MDEVLLQNLITLKGQGYKPYDPFKVLYEKDQPLLCVYKTGRQVAKTTSVIIQHLFQVFSIPHFVVLVVAPLEAQTMRISNMFLRPIYNESKLKKIFATTVDQTLFMSFPNGSGIVFSYAHLDAERTRGVPADKIHLDELQNFNYKFIPVILEAASGSKYGFRIFTGTPLTHNNTLQFYYNQTSQAEWCIKCEACGYWNIPSLEHDLDKMIGPYRDDISEDSPGTVCAKCSRVIYPQKGVWVHRYPEKKWISAGYHVPQPVVVSHYADPVKWSILLSKRDGSIPYADYVREVLGEACDVSARLISLNDLLAVAELGSRFELERIRALVRNYPLRCLGIDWGGGGEGGNYTTLALVCETHDGFIHVPWAIELLTPHDHIREAKEIARFIDLFEPHFIAHDYSGAGALRETILVHNNPGIQQRIMPMRYVVGNDGIACKYVAPTSWHPKPCYHIDPTRCMLIVIGSIKMRLIRFFNDDVKPDLSPGLLRHFLSLIEDVGTARGYESYRIVCEPGYKSEFAHACMLGCIAIWYRTGRWPRLDMRGYNFSVQTN